MMSLPERMPERDAAILGMLPHVPFDGWTNRALRAGIRDAGLPADEADLLFPLGIVDMIETFSDLADRRMEEAAAALSETRLSARVRAVIALRLEQIGRTRRPSGAGSPSSLCLRMRRPRPSAQPGRWMRSGAPRVTVQRISAGTPSG